MKVALVTGPCPPGGCGVGDYTACLNQALQSNGVESHVIASQHWNLFGALAGYRSLQAQNFDLMHIQYPTAGFGYKLGPQTLSLLRACVVTIHEASQRHILRKLALLPFSVRSAHIIFTSRFEREFATAWAPWIARISSVIPIGSNISAGASLGPRELDEIVYFGLIMPGKGLEQVVDLSRLIKSAGLPLRVRIMGKAPLRHSEYLERLRSETANLPFIWDLDCSEQQIAQKLARASISYLPYPDGASERRATLKAMLLNGVAVLTTRGPHTPSGLGSVVKFCQTAEDALAAIRYLHSHAGEMAGMSTGAAHFGKTCTWEGIAKLHLRVYQDALSRKPGLGQISIGRDATGDRSEHGLERM